jgi:hypothetical protein
LDPGRPPSGKQQVDIDGFVDPAFPDHGPSSQDLGFGSGEGTNRVQRVAGLVQQYPTSERRVQIDDRLGTPPDRAVEHRLEVLESPMTPAANSSRARANIGWNR